MHTNTHHTKREGQRENEGRSKRGSEGGKKGEGKIVEGMRLER